MCIARCSSHACFTARRRSMARVSVAKLVVSRQLVRRTSFEFWHECHATLHQDLHGIKIVMASRSRGWVMARWWLASKPASQPANQWLVGYLVGWLANQQPVNQPASQQSCSQPASSQRCLAGPGQPTSQPCSQPAKQCIAQRVRAL